MRSKQSMWGYAEGNPTLVGIVVVVVAIAALAYVGRRLWARRRDRAGTLGRGR